MCTVHLKVLDNRVCIGEQFHLSCQHPDLGNESVYPLGSPIWWEDGTVLTLDGNLYTTPTPSRSETILSVSGTLVKFGNTSHNYTCSVTEATPGGPHGHIEISSNLINIHPLGKIIKQHCCTAVCYQSLYTAFS